MPLHMGDLMGLCGQHPARRMEFDRLYNGLMAEVELGNVSVSHHDGLDLFTYSRGECPWNEFSLLARGLILCPNEKRVVATPFPKFFNYGKVEAALPKDLPFEVFEKVDGSLGILFYHNNEWQIATKGSFTSPQARWAKEWLSDNVETHNLITDYTYVLEIVYPDNRIVIDYNGRESLYLLAIYDGDGYELSTDAVIDCSINCGFDIPGITQGRTLDDLLDVAMKLSHQEEGFVVRFANGFRVKIKGNEYVRVHALISQTTPLGVWRTMRDCEDINYIKEHLPEEILKDFNTINSLIRTSLTETINKVLSILKTTKDWDNKTIALDWAKVYPQTPLYIRDFVYSCRKENWLIQILERGRARNSLFRTCKPYANKLKGYVPSSSINKYCDLTTESSIENDL